MSSTIRENVTLNYQNLLSLRKVMTVEEIQNEMNKIDSFIIESNIERVGPIITIYFEVFIQKKH